MRAALFCIFTYLDTRTLLHAAEVCRDWRFVARHPAVWTRVLLENARVCSKVPVPLCHPVLPVTLAVTPSFPWQSLALQGLGLVTLTTPQLQPGSPKCSPEGSHPGAGPSPANQTHIPLCPDISSLPAVPGNAGSVVHPGPLADTAEPEASAAGQEGEQRGVCPEYPVRPWGGAGGIAPGLRTQSDVRVRPGGGLAADSALTSWPFPGAAWRQAWSLY